MTDVTAVIYRSTTTYVWLAVVVVVQNGFISPVNSTGANTNQTCQHDMQLFRIRYNIVSSAKDYLFCVGWLVCPSRGLLESYRKKSPSSYNFLEG